MEIDPFIVKLKKIKMDQFNKGGKQHELNKNKILCQVCDKYMQMNSSLTHLKTTEHKFFLDKFYNPNKYTQDFGVENFKIYNFSKPGYQFPDLKNVTKNMEPFLRQLKGYAIAQIFMDVVGRKYTLPEILQTDKLDMHGRLIPKVMLRLRQEYLDTL